MTSIIAAIQDSLLLIESSRKLYAIEAHSGLSNSNITLTATASITGTKKLF